MNIRLVLFLMTALVTSATPGRADPPTATTPGANTLPRLVFFLNPNGVPCQLQDKVLRDMAPELKGRAEVVYYKTTEQQDLAQFSRYGIRSLPMLLVTDGAGRERRRAPPGIRSAEEVRLLLKP
jgi:thioredoxin 1